jgi:putative transposase
MPRRPRINTGGFIYHVLNRAVARDAIFLKDYDYLAFEAIIAAVYEKLPVRLLGYCLMPNHWHLVLWPTEDGQLSEFMRLLTVTHTQRWHAHYHSAGTGPLYQGRFKSFPIERDEHLSTVLRYVERNPLRAKKMQKAENWKWSSLFKRRQPEPPAWLLPTRQWPSPCRGDWLQWVNRPQIAKEMQAIQTCIRRGRPYGTEEWIARTSKSLSLESTLKALGRPKKE